jgi:hypothetical protein
MKKLFVVVFLALELIVTGCGNGTATAATTASGTWQAVLTGGAAEASALSFITKFSVNGDGSLSVSSFGFLTVGTCFVSGQTESGSADLVTDTTTNLVTGTITFVVQSGSPAGNTLTLTGTESGSTITGTWVLEGGTGCQGSGDFTMTQSTTG